MAVRQSPSVTSNVWRFSSWWLLLISCTLLKGSTLGNIQSSTSISAAPATATSAAHGVSSSVHVLTPADRSLSSVLVLDIDGTLYDDDCLIESQIRDNCHIFSKTFGYSEQDSEDMHIKFGSTIRGICEYGQPKLTFLDYYNDVYPNMDMSLLRKYSIQTEKGSTGYNVEMGGALQSLHKLDCPIVIASNSPVFHVNRVLTRLGLSKLKVAAFLTPERRGGLTKNEASFWDPLFELYPKDKYLCTLIDDNALNVKLVRQLGVRALRITPRLLLPEALVHFMNLLPSHPSERQPSEALDAGKEGFDAEGEEEFEFNEMSYLEAKNAVDVMSYNPIVREKLIINLGQRIQQRYQSNGQANKVNKVLTAVDLGAGLLNMLPYIHKVFSESVSTISGPIELQYIAFESNKNIRGRTIDILSNKMGFVSIPSDVDLTAATAGTIRADIKSFRGILTTKNDNKDSNDNNPKSMVVTLHLVSEDFMSESALTILKDLLSHHRCSDGSVNTINTSNNINTISVDPKYTKYTEKRFPVDLFIGCCVADLVPPKALAAQVVEMAGDEGGLLYLPITFCGATKLIRGKTVTTENVMTDIEVVSSVGGAGDAAGVGGVSDVGSVDSASRVMSTLEGGRVLPIPSDIEVFDSYHCHLVNQGHHLSTARLMDTLESYGCTVVAGDTRNTGNIDNLGTVGNNGNNVDYGKNGDIGDVGNGNRADIGPYGYCGDDINSSSNWKISRKNNNYMWRCMLRFVALGTAFQSLGTLDLKSWFQSVGVAGGNDDDDDMMIETSNIDILAVLPEVIQRIRSPVSNKGAEITDLDLSLTTVFGTHPADALKSIPSTSRLSSPAFKSASASASSASSASSDNIIPVSRRSVEFLSPRNVHVVDEAIPAVGSKQLLVRTSCSLVSTGTELKVFKGDLDSDQPADLTISGMEDKMTYPMRYGYSLVGTVAAVGADLEESEWLGKVVFTFSPHASAVVIDASSAMVVPKGISPEDAVFLPSMETAVSFAQAARPNLGEKVLVVGQGLIGMLTGAVLSQYADTTIADVSEKRLLAASLFNPRASKWNPKTPLPAGLNYDLSVEVSGHPGGLQTAIDSTGTHGRIVVGSWYGEQPAPLKLGLKFHRSGLQLVTSQVSNIPPELTGRWDKNRRFDLTWDCIRQIKPSRLISSVTLLRSQDVLDAYIRLERGEEITALFRDFI